MANFRVVDASYPGTRRLRYVLQGDGEEVQVATIEKSDATSYAHVWIHDVQSVKASRLAGIGDAIAAAVAQAQAWEDEAAKGGRDGMKEKITKIEQTKNGVAIYRGCVFAFVTPSEAARIKVGDEWESTEMGYPVLWIKINGKMVRNCRNREEVQALLCKNAEEAASK